MIIEIEKNIPFPKRKFESKYPFSEMEIGDSFFVKANPPALYAAAKKFVKESGKSGWTFRIAKEEKGARLWRTA